MENEIKEHKKFKKILVNKGKSKKIEDPKLAELLSFQRKNKLLYGAKICEKKFKTSNVKKIFITNSCCEKILAKIKHYAKLSNCEIVNLEISKEDLSHKLEKPFMISMMCVIGENTK